MHGHKNKHTMPKLSKLFLTGVLASCIASTTLLTGCDAEKTDIEYVQSAKSFAEKGDFKASVIELKNALQQNAQNKEARFLLAQAHLRNQDGASAEKELLKAVSYGLDKQRALDEFATAYYYQFKFDELLAETLILKDLTLEQTSHVQFLRAMAGLNRNKKDDAILDFKFAIEIAPNTPYSTLSSAYLKLLDATLKISPEKHRDEALLILDQLLKNHPDMAEALILKGKIYSQKKAFPQSVAAYEKAIQIEPNRLALHVDYSRLLIANKQLEEAERVIDFVLKSAPSHIPSLLIKSSLRLQSKDYETALLNAEKVLNISEVNQQAKLTAGVANFYLKNYERARKQLSAIVQFTPESHMARRMLAYSEFKLGYVDEASKTLGAISNPQEKDQALFSEFGIELAKQGNFDDAQNWIEKAIELNPGNIQLQTRLGILKLMQKDESGLDDLDSVLKQNDNSPAARMALVKYHLEQKNIDAARKVAQQWIQDAPNVAEGYILAADIEKKQGNIEKSRTLLNKALEEDPKNILALISLARIEESNKNIAAAKGHIQKVLTIDPVHESALIVLYRLSKSDNTQASVIEKIEDTIDKNPDKDGIKYVQALVLGDLKNYPEAINTLKNVTKKSPDYARAQNLTGRLYLRTDDKESALTHFKNWQKVQPENVNAHRTVITLLETMKNKKQALTETQSALQILPNNQYLQVTEVALLFLNAQPQQAQKRMAKLEQRGVNLPQFHLLKGQYALTQKDYTTAVKELSIVHKQRPTVRSVLLLAEAYKLNDQPEKGTAHLEDWVKTHPEDDTVRLFLANNSLNKDHKNAIKQYKLIVEKTPSNYIALNNLAWALGESGKITEAVKYAEQAHTLKPESAAILDTYGFLLYQSGQIDKALTNLTKAYNKNSKDPSISYHYALVLKQSGDKSKAKSILEDIKSQKFTEQEQALKLLKSL